MQCQCKTEADYLCIHMHKLYAPWIFMNVILCEYICVYINVPYSVTFRLAALSIVQLGLGLVVGLGSVLF